MLRPPRGWKLMWKSCVPAILKGDFKKKTIYVLKTEALSVWTLFMMRLLDQEKPKSFSSFLGCQAMNGFLHYCRAPPLL